MLPLSKVQRRNKTPVTPNKTDGRFSLWSRGSADDAYDHYFLYTHRFVLSDPKKANRDARAAGKPLANENSFASLVSLGFGATPTDRFSWLRFLDFEFWRRRNKK
jgi:hypothetical protein